MSIWGRLAGAAAGFAEGAHVSGPVRGLLGALAGGHIFHHDNDSSAQHQVEEQFLADVAQRFGFTRTQFNYIKARHVSAVVKSDPYEVLGIAPDVDDETLRSHYHQLVLDNHPDRMIARGVPPEFVSLATKKVAVINAAYEAVAKERRI